MRFGGKKRALRMEKQENLEGLSGEDAVFAALAKGYRLAGYAPYRLKKFEEYSLYLENAPFIENESVITFNDAKGRLLALRPDVTLSVVKNTKAAKSGPEKLFYRENVYRMDKRTREYKEICQAGVECIGGGDLTSTLEVILLAAQSLGAVDTDFVLNLSHMGLIRGIFADCGIGGAETEGKNENTNLFSEITAHIRAKNSHDLEECAKKAGIPREKAKGMAGLFAGDNDFKCVLRQAVRLVSGEKTSAAADELGAIYQALESTPYHAKIKPDFSILGDMHYYNGVVMRGYVKNAPKSVLSGGRYDNLAAKFEPGVKAMGFALNLSEIAAAYKTKPEYDADILLLYEEGDTAVSAAKVIQKAKQLRAGGSVLTARSMPRGKKFREMFRLTAAGDLERITKEC